MKSSLDYAAEDVYKQLEVIGGNPVLLPPVLQPVALLYTFQAMVDNGGFQYPMENDFPFNPPYSAFSDSYRKIGAERAADSLDKAVALFPFTHPEREQSRRLEFFESLPEDHEFYILSDLVCGDETVWLLMEKYVSSHSESFKLTPDSIN